jgi:hypothetical protein
MDLQDQNYMNIFSDKFFLSITNLFFKKEENMSVRISSFNLLLLYCMQMSDDKNAYLLEQSIPIFLYFLRVLNLFIFLFYFLFFLLE